VSDIEDENLLDVDTAEVHPETPNTFGRNLLRRLSIAHDKNGGRGRQHLTHL